MSAGCSHWAERAHRKTTYVINRNPISGASGSAGNLACTTHAAKIPTHAVTLDQLCAATPSTPHNAQATTHNLVINITKLRQHASDRGDKLLDEGLALFILGELMHSLVLCRRRTHRRSSARARAQTEPSGLNPNDLAKKSPLHLAWRCISPIASLCPDSLSPLRGFFFLCFHFLG